MFIFDPPNEVTCHLNVMSPQMKPSIYREIIEEKNISFLNRDAICAWLAEDVTLCAGE